jgi:hypothetical protein
VIRSSAGIRARSVIRSSAGIRTRSGSRPSSLPQGGRRPAGPPFTAYGRGFGDSPRRQFRLRQESGRRAFGDQLRIVGFGARRDQDHLGAAALIVPGQEPGQVKAALVPEPDVDEDDVRP